MSLPLSSAFVEGARAKYSVKSGDWGTIQAALPSVTANSSVEIQIHVHGPFKVQGMTDYTRPQGLSDPAGISIAVVDLTAPVRQNSFAYAVGNFIVLGGVVFKCTAASGNSAASAPTFNLGAGATTVDGSVTWTYIGPGAVVKLRFANSSAGAQTPATQQYDFYQF